MNPNWQNFISTRGARLEAGQIRDFGDTQAELKAAATGTVLAPLSQFGLIRATGDDAATFLHNLLSNDVQHLAHNRAERCGFCSPKGRLLADFLIWREAHDYLLQLSADIQPALLKKLGMYVLRSKVKLMNAGDDIVLLGLAGDGTVAALKAAGLDVPAAPMDVAHCAAGSVIRLHDDGRVPADNPFVIKPGAKPEKFTLGNRNMQGAALHPQTGEIWAHEHGPQGGDEINIIRAGVNYGWPVITYGRNYGTGTKIGEGTAKPGMAQPLLYWTPSIAPSGMAFYTGERFPGWRGNLFVGALAGQILVRLQLDGERIVHQERLLEGALGRIRDVRQGPDGLLYLLIDSAQGRIVRLEPQ